MDVLDTDWNTIAAFYDTGLIGDYPENILVDGNVDVDITRLTRRTFSATVLNEDGIWSPDGAYGGTFYVNRLVRFWRGIAYGDYEEVVPIGVFAIDSADVEVERGMSMVVLSGSDLWKKLGKSVFPKARSWAANTYLNTIIADICDEVGLTFRNLDPLLSRTDTYRRVMRKFSVEQGDNRGEALARLATGNYLDIYFDQLGFLTTQDFKSPGDAAVVYAYGPEANNNLVTVKASYTDDNLYNTVLVIGTADKENIVTSRISDTNPQSVTNVSRIGERVFIHEDDTIGSQTVADKVAESLFYKHVLVNEDITLEVICNPAFEGNDVIKISETDFSKLDNTYRLKAFTIPLSSSRQTLRLLREIKLN